MSPVSSKSKSKDKSAAKAVKEQQKASSKASATPLNSGNGVAANAYNPISGTFHALETASSTTTIPPSQSSNRRFPRTIIDETVENPCSLLDPTAEYDSVSNNDSCSGESEDHQKDKKNTANTTSRADPIPGYDGDKREKTRLKNEKKYQRQKERRVQELHERCCSYLSSRKLELLAQKLVAMGFTSEKATMALIHNEGRVEESALWLLEMVEESTKPQATPNPDGVNNAKIDISDELAKIAELELSFKCTKQEIRRAVVACEGDLGKVEETLKAAQRQESPPSPCGDRLAVASSLVKGVAAAPPRRDERDFNYTKSPAISQPPLRKAEPSNKPPSDKRLPSASPGPAAAAAAQAKPENRPLREPVYVMQRPQPNGTTRQNANPARPGLGSSPPSSTGWYPSGMPNPQQLHHHHNQQQFISSLAVPSSLGLYSGWRSSGAPTVDWNTRGSMPQCDYTSIDWSLDLTPMALSASSIRGERLYDNSWHASYTTPTKAGGSGASVVDQHRPATAPAAGSPDWTSPFGGKDIFRTPRQFVSSPPP